MLELSDAVVGEILDAEDLLPEDVDLAIRRFTQSAIFDRIISIRAKRIRERKRAG
jgi:hypothetical protein